MGSGLSKGAVFCGVVFGGVIYLRVGWGLLDLLIQRHALCRLKLLTGLLGCL